MYSAAHWDFMTIGIMQPLKVSCEPWCVNESDTFGVLLWKMSNLWDTVGKKYEACNWNYSWLTFSFCCFQALPSQPWFYQVNRGQCAHCPFSAVCVCLHPPLIQPWAAPVPCRLNVSSLTLMSRHNLFVCLRGLPCCPHNVGQSIIMWPVSTPPAHCFS